MRNLKLCQVASGIQLLDNMLIHVVPLCLFIPDWSLQAYDEVQLLATDCQTDSLALLHRHPRKWTTSTWQEEEKKHKTCGLAAVVQHTISLLRVSHIETGAPPSPDPNYNKIFKSWLCFWKLPSTNTYSQPAGYSQMVWQWQWRAVIS